MITFETPTLKFEEYKVNCVLLEQDNQSKIYNYDVIKQNNTKVLKKRKIKK